MEQNHLRPTGIELIGEVPWGTHFCQFYHTREDLLDTLVPYFKAGLENNEFCMWVTSEPLGVPDAIRTMSEAVPGFDGYLERGQILIIPHDHWYVREGAFNQQLVLTGWVEKLDQARARGFDGLRLTGNTFWLEKKDWDDFAEYEAAVQSVIGNYRMLAICTYSLDKCSTSDVLDVMRTHEFALIRKEGDWQIIENAAYRQAERALGKSNERFRLLAETASLLLASDTPERTVDAICRQVMAHLDCQVFFNYLLDEKKHRLHLNACAGVPGETGKAIEWLDLGVAVGGCVARDGGRIVAEHIGQVPDERTDLVRSFGVKAYACHPLVARGRVIGTLSFGAIKRETFKQEEIDFMKTVSDHVAAAMERKRTYQALEESYQKLSDMLHSIRDGFFALDDELKVTYFNPAAEQLLNRKAGEVLGQKLFDAFPEARGSIFEQNYTRVLRDKQPLFFEAFFGVEPYVNWYDVRAFPTEEGLVVFFQVTTERKEAEDSLRRRTEELARSNAELEQFAYVASHDLQEPLRMVSSYVQLLKERYQGKLDRDADDFIGYAHDGSTRMQRLINDLLAYSRIGTRGREFQVVNLETALTRAEDNLKLAIQESGTVITHETLPQVYGDGVQLAQVFQNLIDNAIKFHGDAPPRAHVSAELNGNECVCSVRDNGVGILPEYFPKLFLLFQRLHTREEYPGTGLGLAICKRIVERHGGRIWVESTPGAGSIFRFTLPVTKIA
ncbi:MAG: MEDS domain-containing protein [Chloroflexi bacterium]|nr:MEDS domain-containing protein [Chloroflexota bacterium]